MSYAEFIAAKLGEVPDRGFAANGISEQLYPFQRDIVEWSAVKGRAAIFADCGLGKTPMQLEWANKLLPTPWPNDHTGAEKETREARRGMGATGGPSLRDLTHLLPTPTASDSQASGGNTPSDVTLTDAVVRTSLGARTNPRFDGGNKPLESLPPGQLTIEDA